MYHFILQVDEEFSEENSTNLLMSDQIDSIKEFKTKLKVLHRYEHGRTDFCFIEETSPPLLTSLPNSRSFGGSRSLLQDVPQ